MKKQILIIILLLLNSLIAFIPIRGNPEGDNENLGWELLDDGAVLHIWNKHNSYYFDTDSGIQLTNHYEEYWTHNVMMLGYYDNEEWNLIYRTDVLSGFNKNIETDNATYVNATIWKDLTYNSYNFRLAIRYCLGVDDSDLTVIPSIKNLGIEIPYTLAFGWEMKDIQIDNNIENDQIRINGTRYFLNQELDNSYTNLSSPIHDDLGNVIGWSDAEFYLEQINDPMPAQFLYLKWNKDLNYLVTVKSRANQYNAPVTLFVRIGTLNAGQEKSTELHWYDAEGDYISSWNLVGGSGSVYGIATDGTNIWVADAINDKVAKYAMDGTHITNWSVGPASVNPRGLTTNGTYVWLVDTQNDKVRKYQMDGTYISEWALTGDNGYPQGLAHNATHLWVSDGPDNAVYKYKMDGTYVDSFSISAGVPLVWGITTDGNYFWMPDLSHREVYKYYMDGSYTGNHWDTDASGNGNPEGITTNGYYFWILDGNDKMVYKYEGPTQIINSNPQPSDGATNISINPYLNITVNHTQGVDITKRTNASGSWGDIFWLNNTGNTTMSNLTSGIFTNFNTTYWWSVNTTDGTDWTNDTYHFTTRTGITSVNASTGVEETNATLHGYITNNSNGSYSYGFWVGTTTPLTEGNADHNMTGSGYVMVTGNRDFSHNDTNLTQGIHYYVRAWVSNATCFDSSNNEEDFWTKCDAPSGFTATVSGCNVTLAWTKGTGADKTTVVRKVDFYPANQTDGTVVYNDSGVSYSDTTAGGSHQYYRAWSWVGDKHSDGNASANISVPPCPPTNVDTNVLSNNTFDVVWTKGAGAVNTVVRRKLNSRPSSVTDGIQVYNGTGTQINIQSILNYYYSLWSYANITYSSQVNITVGGLVINCYDEETNGSLWFDVSISNQDGSQTYESLNNTNPLILNISQLPIGDDIKITISAASNYSDKSETFTGYPPDENYTITYIILSQTADSKSTTNVTCINEGDDAHSYPSFTLDNDLITILPDNADKFTKIFVNYTHEEYSSRLYYRDIEESTFSFLNIYLPPTEDKQLYLLEVIDEAGNTVSDVHIEVKRSVNGTFVVVSRLLTDANGQADIDLISDRNYIFIISKEGYVTENASWTPGTDIFTHTFKIIWEVIPFEPDTFGDIINFYGTLYVNNTMMVTFYDLDNAMSNSHFIIYEDYNDTLTYMGEYNGTTSNDIVFWINVDNATRLHIVVLYMNHSTLREVINYRIFVYPVHIDREGGTWLENLIVSVVGDFDYGYVLTLMWVLPCVLLIAGLASIGHPGTGILGAGLYSMWITWNITLPEEAKILTFASIAIVVGFITIVLVKGTKVVH